MRVTLGNVVWALVIIAAVIYLMPATPMDKCQIEHSYDTCVSLLYR